MTDLALHLLAITAQIDEILGIIDSIDPNKLSGRELVKATKCRKELREARAYIYSMAMREKGL